MYMYIHLYTYILLYTVIQIKCHNPDFLGCSNKLVFESFVGGVSFCFADPDGLSALLGTG